MEEIRQLSLFDTGDETIKFIPDDELQAKCVVSIFSDGETRDWGLASAGIPLAHVHTRGAGITVAVLDTGIADHDDLRINVLDRRTTVDSDSLDHTGHGTHVAGIIGAAANGFGIVGVAPEVKIVGIKVLPDGGRGGWESIEQGIRLATDMGVDVINMSLGCPFVPPASLHQACQEAEKRGIIIVAAAGNDRGAVNYPAAYPEVVAVAAIDKNGNMAGFSSHGPEVALGAPGVDIYSTYLNNGYAVLDGTSQAAPFTTGIVALILSWLKANPSLPKVAGVKDVLARLDDITDPVGRFGTTGKYGSLGFGIPSFANAKWDV